MRHRSYLLTLSGIMNEGVPGCRQEITPKTMVTVSVGTFQINTNAETQTIRSKENRRVELKKTDGILVVKFCQDEVIVC